MVTSLHNAGIALYGDISLTLGILLYGDISLTLWVALYGDISLTLGIALYGDKVTFGKSSAYFNILTKSVLIFGRTVMLYLRRNCLEK